MTCQGPRIHLSGPATWKWALLSTTLKEKRRRNERDKKRETKDGNGKWRKMHRLIKKTIELFYMDTFWSRLQCEKRSCSKTSFTVQLVHNDRELALIDEEFEDRSYRCVFLSCKRGEGRRGRLLSYCIEWKTKHTRTSTSSRTGLTKSLQSIQAYLFDGASLLSVTNRRRKTTKDVGHTLRQFRCGFFVTKNEAVEKCQSILEWVPCLPWRQKAAWHIRLFFFRMTTWHFSVDDLSHLLQREIWESYSVLVIVMTCCIHSEARICSTRHKFQWSFQQSEKGPDLGRVARATQTGLGLHQGPVAWATQPGPDLGLLHPQPA